MGVRQRLDLALVERGLAPTRARARDLIARGLVTIAGEPAAKPAVLVDPGTVLAVVAAEAARVSRGGVKLEAALAAFSVPIAGLHALDIGASTGGFTEVLLAAGVAHVTAVDVGHQQLHPRLLAEPRVSNLEGRDARTLTAADLPAPPRIITADVSFVSLTKVLPAALALAAPGAWLVALIKPQFELGRDAIGKGGLLKPEIRAESAVDLVADWLIAQPGGWTIAGTIPSPLPGGAGALEFLLAARKDGP